jgi:uncharacterized protein (DUF1015 family)
MAEIEPLRALHYDLGRTGGLQPVVSPPYDVIGPEQRTDLLAASPYNAVAIDLPQSDHGDPYEHAAETLREWIAAGVLTRDADPAVWALEQDYVGPDVQPRTRRGFLARVRVQPYGPGTVRPHERTHPGPKQDRLRLTRATRANLSPIFALYSDPGQSAWAAITAVMPASPFGTHTDADGTVSRLYRITDPATIARVQRAAAPSELLIADGHHRYETARVYAEEVGEHDGPHRFLLTCLVALQDPGLTVFPTHRLVRGLTESQREHLRDTLTTAFEVTPLQSPDELTPPAGERVTIGYLDGYHRRPLRLTLRDEGTVAGLLAGHSAAYRQLDTAVLEALVLKHTLGYTDEDIDHLNGLGYARSHADAVGLIDAGEYEAAFFMAPIPVTRIQEVADAGETMPPKSTYFYPKVPTGLIFNPLDSE